MISIILKLNTPTVKTKKLNWKNFGPLMIKALSQFGKLNIKDTTETENFYGKL